MNPSKWQNFLPLLCVVSWKPKILGRLFTTCSSRMIWMWDCLFLIWNHPKAAVVFHKVDGACFTHPTVLQSMNRGRGEGGLYQLHNDGLRGGKVSVRRLSGLPQTAVLSPFSFITGQVDLWIPHFSSMVTVSCQPHFFLATVPWLVPPSFLKVPTNLGI